MAQWVRLVLLAALLVSAGRVTAHAQEDTPRFEPTDCTVTLPPGFRGTERVACGYVTVPEDRDEPSNIRTIRLAVVVLHPRSGEPLPTPVMVLDGGPGTSAMNWLVYGGYAYYAEPVLDTNRSIIFFTQRGVYPAEPVFSCDFDVAAAREFSNEANKTTRDALLASWGSCLDQLAQITDLSTFHSTAIAADANDIRRALGYEQVDLWGGSYGTRVGLTLLRDYPGTIRAAILEKPLPLDVNPEIDLLGHRVDALERMFTACASDALCAKMAPNLRATFFETALALNTDPIVITRGVAGSDALSPMVIDGRRFVRLINVAATPYLRYFPRLIVDASEGRLVESLDALWGPAWTAEGVNLLPIIAACNEEWPFVTAGDITAAAEAVPEYAPFVDTESLRLTLEVCALGNFRTPPPNDNAPVTSDVPVLLLAGEYDYATPPAYAERIAATLDHAYAITVPYAGHDLMSVSPCPTALILDFLDDPTTAPDTRCLDVLQQAFSWAETLPSN